jgi:DNA polymerase
MDENLLKKLISFLEGYRILYRDELFIDSHRIDSLVSSITLPVGELIPPVQQMAKRSEPENIRESKKDHPLWQFREEIKNCVKCPLGHNRQNFVFGDGNPDAGIMFVGEAPGAEEDRTGIPFVGRAGQLLNKLLAGIHIDRKDVFIANILKCRPPNNRDPQPEEVETCIPYLHKQIEMIKPKVIVALGRIAAQNLLDTTSTLKQMRERLWQYQGVNMIVTYHPAAILRNPGLLDVAKDDFKFILKTYQDVLKHQI